MTTARTRRRSASPALMALLGLTFVLASAATLSAQIVCDPRVAEFDPSPDHSMVLSSGQPAVLSYRLAVYLVGASAPFTIVDMGKPSPDPDGKVRYDFSSEVVGWPLPGGNYEARVSAVGPEGSALSSQSNPFTFTTGSPCTITLSATTARIPASGGSYRVDVSTGAGCDWAVTTSLAWVTLRTAGGSGSGTAPFDVQANASSSSRGGTITFGGQTLTITQDAAPPPRTTPTVSWATPAAITQGTALSATQLNATASVAGTFVYVPAAGTVLAPGTHTLTASFTPTDTTRYTTAAASTTLVVGGDGAGGGVNANALWRHHTLGAVWLWSMSGVSQVSQKYVSTVADTNWEIRDMVDQDGDGDGDLLWRNKAQGHIYLWTMNGATPSGETYVATVRPEYDIAGTGDFNGDGRPDILWRHTQGAVWVWLMNGATRLKEAYVGWADPGYVIKGISKLDGDAKADIVWHHATRGEVWVWLMDGATRRSQTWIDNVPDTGYQIQDVADFNGDAKADILWHHATSGEVWIWTMNGNERATERMVAIVPDTGYRPVAAGDFSGDTKADIVWHHATRGDVWMWLMDGTSRLSQFYVATMADVGYQIVTVR